MVVGKILLIIVAMLLAPLVGGLIAGVDRRVTAWLQSRFGPPILQPIYDVLKLFGKKLMVVNSWQVFCVWVYFFSAAISLLLFFLQSDLLLLFFVLTIGAVFLVVGAMAVPSPYSQVGAQRELMQMLAYEPLLIMVFIGIYMVTGSFEISEVYKLKEPMLYQAPLLFIALGYALTIKLRKSPFDISASAHAHQEVVRGVMTEYSGPLLGLIEVAHWLEILVILGLVSLFWATSWIGMLILLAVTYFLELVIDNATSRMTWDWMLKHALGWGVALCLINYLGLYALK